MLELFCEMLIMLIRQGEVRKWLNGESFICGVFRFCYGAGGVWVKCLFYYYYCLVFLSVRLILSLICIKQTVIHPAFPETRDSLIPQKSIFNILSIIRTLANTISIQSLKTPKNIRTHADTVPGPREEIFPNRRTTKYIAIHKTTNNETTLNK